MAEGMAGLQIGDTLADRYRIVGLLGEGGMSKVFLAEDVKLKGKRWAVKEATRLAEDVQTFVDEAEMLIHLQHPYLPSIVDYYLPNEHGNLCIVMDYIKGKTLLQLFEDNNHKLPVRSIVKYAIQLCDLFHYLHHYQTGAIIYRDLKPSNVMIDDQDNVRLIDFGIARSFKSSKFSDTIRIGTFGFAAPEQFENNQSDSRTDLYTLGTLLYFLLSKGSYYYLTQRKLDEEGQDIPIQLVEIVHKLLQKNPDDRIQDALEVREALQKAAGIVKEPPFGAERTGDNPAVKLLPTKLVVIGSMYAGAGSTFVTMALAKALDQINIPHAVVEFPLNEPAHYSLLFGEAHAPENYTFTEDNIRKDETADGKPEWRDGHTVWHPINPAGNGLSKEWGTEQYVKLLYSIKAPIVIVDLSHGSWGTKEAELICRMSDEIVMVADPNPFKMSPAALEDMLQTIDDLAKRSGSFHLIANRDHLFPSRKEWLRSLPLQPLCNVPEIPYSDMVESLWKGKFVQSKPEYRVKLCEALLPLVSRIVPPACVNKSGKSGRKYGAAFSWLGKWKKTSF